MTTTTPYINPNKVNIGDLHAALAKGLVTVKFKKVDNSIREGIFTTNPELVAAAGWKPAPVKEGAKPRVANPSLLNMYEARGLGSGWKSTKIDSVLSFSEYKDPVAK
jgi:hypothetical protein